MRRAPESAMYAMSHKKGRLVGGLSVERYNEAAIRR
jgi:hypothetical protein